MANKNSILTSSISTITEEEVVDAQIAWGEGIVRIGEIFIEKFDPKFKAIQADTTLTKEQRKAALAKARLEATLEARPEAEIAAREHINTYYGYDISLVLFKPTLASEHQFRNTFDAALSYFIGGNPAYKEDKGFALTPWTAVAWENVGIINSQTNMAIAMGNYYFTPKYPNDEGKIEITKVEYTFGYVKDVSGNVRVIVHKSSLPFKPE